MHVYNPYGLYRVHCTDTCTNEYNGPAIKTDNW